MRAATSPGFGCVGPHALELLQRGAKLAGLLERRGRAEAGLGGERRVRGRRARLAVALQRRRVAARDVPAVGDAEQRPRAQRARGVALEQLLEVRARLPVIPERERAARDGEAGLVGPAPSRVEADQPLILHDRLPAVPLARLEDLPEQALRLGRPGAGPHARGELAQRADRRVLVVEEERGGPAESQERLGRELVAGVALGEIARRGPPRAGDRRARRRPPRGRTAGGPPSARRPARPGAPRRRRPRGSRRAGGSSAT